MHKLKDSRWYILSFFIILIMIPLVFSIVVQTTHQTPNNEFHFNSEDVFRNEINTLFVPPWRQTGTSWSSQLAVLDIPLLGEIYLFCPDCSVIGMMLLKNYSVEMLNDQSLPKTESAINSLTSIVDYTDSAIDNYEKCHRRFIFSYNNNVKVKYLFNPPWSVGDILLRHVSPSKADEVMSLSSELGLGKRCYKEEIDENHTKTYCDVYVERITDEIYFETLSEFVSFVGDIALKGTLLGISSLVDDTLSCLDACTNKYYTSYIYAADTAVQLAFDLAGEDNNALRRLYSTYSEAKDYGMCDDDYFGPGKDLCEDMEKELYSIDQNMTSSYFTIARHSYYVFTKDIATNPTPLFTNFKSFVDASLRFMNKVGVFESSLNESINKTISIVNTNIAEAQTTLAYVNERISFADENKIYKINSMVFSTSDATFSIQPVNKLYEMAKDNATRAEADISLAKTLRDTRGENTQYSKWIKLMYTSSSNAKQESLMAKSLIDKSISNAREVVVFIRGKASEEIQKAESLGANISVAKEYFSKGESTNILGDKFEFYFNAYMAAIDAQTSFYESFDCSNNSTVVEMLSYVEDLLNRAEQDSIDVSVERDRFEFIKNNPDEHMVEKLIELSQDIISKAKIAYADLQGLHDEVWDYIRVSNGYFDYLIPDVRAAEAGIVENNVINYESGLGRLHLLRQKYLDILTEINSKKDIALSPDVSYSFNIPDTIPVDEEVVLSGEIYVANNYPFSLTSPKITVHVPFEVSQEDVSGDVSIAVYDPDENELIVTLNEMSPFSTSVILIEKGVVIARTTETYKETIGDRGYKIVKEHKTLYLSQGADYIDFGSSHDSIVVDGKTAGTGPVVYIGKPKGSYDLTIIDEYPNAYTYSRDNYQFIDMGDYYEVHYTLNVDPKGDEYDTLAIPLKKEETTASFDSPIQYYIDGRSIVFEKVSSPFSVNVVYTTDKDVGEQIEDDLNDIINNTNLTDEEWDIVDDINESLNNGDYGSAMDMLDDLKHRIEMRQRELERYGKKLSALLSQLSREISLLKEAIEYANETNTTGDIVETYEIRLKALIELNNTVYNKPIGEAIHSLSTYDPKWSDKASESFIRDALKEESKIKKEYMLSNYHDVEIEQHFSSFEHTYATARANLHMSFKPVIDLQRQLNMLVNYYNKYESSHDSKLQSKENYLSKLRQEVNNLLSKYTDMYKRAKESNVDEFFPHTPTYFSSKMKYISTKNERAIDYSISQLRHIKSELLDSFSSLNKSTTKQYELAKRMFVSAQSVLDSKTKERISKGLVEAAKAIDEGDFVKSLSISKNIIHIISKYKVNQSKPNPLVVLFGLFILIVAGILFYKGDIKLSLPKNVFGKKKEVKLRRLKRGDEGIRVPKQLNDDLESNTRKNQ